MTVTLRAEQLDWLAPFSIVCGDGLRIIHAGRSLAKLAPAASPGRPLLEAVEVVRPASITSPEDVARNIGAVFVVRVPGTETTIRYQALALDSGETLLVGSPVFTSDEHLSDLGLTVADFAPIDQTLDLLMVRRAQERTLADLSALNAELDRNARELRQTNRSLADTERLYRTLVEQQPLVTYMDAIGPGAETLFSSRNVEDLFGYPVESWLDRPGFFLEITHPDDHERVLAEHLRTQETGERFHAEFRMRAADGRDVWVLVEDSVVHDDQGNPAYRLGFILDVTPKKIVEHDLRAATTRLSTLIASLQAAVLVEDETRHLVLANDEFCQMFGIPAAPEVLVGADCAEAAERTKALMRDPEGFVTRIGDVLRARRPVRAEEVELADGQVLERDYLPIVREGEALGHVWVYRDITERKEAERELARARDEALAASAAKSDFLATMSHEIRTPMNGVLAAIDLLAGTPLDPSQGELVDIVRTSAGALLRVINDILDLQKVESGHVELVAEPFDLAQVVKGVVDLLTPSALGKEIGIGSHVDPGIPVPVRGDALRVRQVLLNLAGNSVKFTEAGGVTIAAELERLDADVATVRFTVADTGVGMSGDLLERMFEPFVQGEDGEEGGTGLGLAIAERLVRLMGGTLAVDSEVGTGTTIGFALTLPCGGEAGYDTEAGLRTQTVAIGDSTVLVAEDNEINRDVALRQLARLGVAARAVTNGREAVEALLHGRYDLVLMDVRMPEIDGLEATRLIRDRERRSGTHVPIVGLTANALPGDRALCLDAGMDDYVTKPLSLAELRAVLERWLSGGRVAPVPAAADGDALDRLAEELGGVAACSRIAERWLTELDGRVAELHLFVEEDERERALLVAHTLKSTSALVGAAALCDASARIEAVARAGDPVDRALVAELSRAAAQDARSVRAWLASRSALGPAREHTAEAREHTAEAREHTPD